MRHLQQYEGFFSKIGKGIENFFKSDDDKKRADMFKTQNLTKTIRISLNESEFADLCKTGSLATKAVGRIKISNFDFERLIDGEKVTITNHGGVNMNIEVVLKDIGFNKIAKYMSMSPFY